MSENNRRPSLTLEEDQRVDILMAELMKVQKKEEEIKKELRRLIYKIEKVS
jgi:hypothetical protein